MTLPLSNPLGAELDHHDPRHSLLTPHIHHTLARAADAMNALCTMSLLVRNSTIQRDDVDHGHPLSLAQEEALMHGIMALAAYVRNDISGLVEARRHAG